VPTVSASSSGASRPPPLHLPQPVQRDRHADGVQPRAERGVAAEGRHAIEGTHEGLLGEVARQLLVSGQAVGQAVDAVDVLVVDEALRGHVAGHGARDELGFGHGARSREAVR